MANDDNSWVHEVGRISGYYTEDPDEACLYVVPGKNRYHSKLKDEIISYILIISDIFCIS